jgi:dihydrofolate reductase
MKLTTMTQVTIDGVMQGNGHASEEDRRNGFERGGWARGKGDKETNAFINQTYQRADAFLLGRRTYEVFAATWGSLTEQDVPGWEPVMRALNTQPKYVASTTLARLIVVPVVLGQGARLFPDAGPDLALDLVESRVDSKGVTIQVYRPAGRPQYAAA